MALHAFVAMPFGIKDSGPGEAIDFDAVYTDLIKPALEAKGFEVFRADEAKYAGAIRPDMFQELLLADLVVADISLENANVWYELGIRHALRKGDVVSIRREGARLPFDVRPDRAITYPLAESGRTVQPDQQATAAAAILVPRPGDLDSIRRTIGEYAQNTTALWHGRAVSPVYLHLRDLKEPGWRQLSNDGAVELWEGHRRWEDRVKQARRDGHPADVMVLAEEAPTCVLQFEAYRTAGNALMSLKSFKLALEQLDRALELKPGDIETRQKRAVVLGRLDRGNEARGVLDSLVRDIDADDTEAIAETKALLGRVEKDDWLASWKKDDSKDNLEARKRRAAGQRGRLAVAIEAYTVAFEATPGHYYSGINAVTLRHLYIHLTGEDNREWPQPADLEGGVRWAIRSALGKDKRDYWARATLAELEVLTAGADRVAAAYGDAVAVADGNWFNLDSSRQQLDLLRSLGFRPAEVASGLEILEDELNRLAMPDKESEPQRIVLFSGHMIDGDDREETRFPRKHEPAATEQIRARLDELGGGAGDLALCGGACGGDLIFAELCLERGMDLEVRIPFQTPEFLEASVRFAADRWQDRFHAVVNHEHTTLLEMPHALGPTPPKRSPYARNNVWQLYSALCRGPDKVRFIALWDGKPGDGEGGTEHMWNAVKARTGLVYRVDTKALVENSTP